MGMILPEKQRNERVQYPIVFSIKLDLETRKEIDDISFFERKKPSTWARDVIVAAVRTYQRNPQYKAFRKRLMGEAEKKTENISG